MENTQHSNLLLLYPNGARSLRFDALGIVPRLARLLRLLWQHKGGNQVANHWADETGAAHTCDSRLCTNNALKAATRTYDQVGSAAAHAPSCSLRRR